jgi:hypothetical protein
MTKTLLYTYLGTNGTLITPIHLQNVYCVKKYQLTADNNKHLTKNGKDLYKTITVLPSEVDSWYEIED